MPQAIKEETMSDDEVIFMHVDTGKMTGRSKSKGKGRDQQIQAPPIAFKLERSPSITAGPSTMSKKQERDEFNRSPSSSSSPPPAPPSTKAPVSTFDKFEAKAALARQEAKAAEAAAASSKQSHNATASSSKSKSSISSSKPRVSAPSSSNPSKPKPSSSSAPKLRRSDPPASSAISKTSSSSKNKLVPGGSTFIKSLAERPSVASGRSVRVEGSNAVRFLENEAWEAFSQFGQIDIMDVLVTTRSNHTKDIFITYVERAAADAAVSTINTEGFPVLEHVRKISLWTNLSLGKSVPLKATKVVSMVFDYHTEKWLRGGGVICYTGTGVKKRVLAPSSDGSSDSDSSSDESEAAPPLKKYKPSAQPEAAPIPVVAAPSKRSSANDNAGILKKKRVVSSSDEDSSSDEEEFVPRHRPYMVSSEPESSPVPAPSQSSSKKSSTNINDDMDLQPGTVLRIPPPAPAAAAAAQPSNVVDRKGKGKERQVIDLLSSSDMEASPPPQDLQGVADMDRMSLEPNRKSKTPAPPRPVSAPKKLIANDDSSGDGSDDDRDSDDSDAEHLDIGELFGDLPVARPPPPSAPWMLASSSRNQLAAPPPRARPQAPVPPLATEGATGDGSSGDDDSDPDYLPGQPQQPTDKLTKAQRRVARGDIGCPFCPSRYLDWLDLRSHKLGSHADFVSRCTKCPIVLPKDWMEAHLVKHDLPLKKRRTCKICKELHAGNKKNHFDLAHWGQPHHGQTWWEIEPQS